MITFDYLDSAKTPGNAVIDEKQILALITFQNSAPVGQFTQTLSIMFLTQTQSPRFAYVTLETIAALRKVLNVHELPDCDCPLQK